ncbi:lipoprotein (plasmid) [Candidatus Borrelia fainii]|uniref:Lipoprotein n=1 Tax=Candidatus Borrelia fainii TaxID=2518322 RepID=A0ABM8DLV7_9SPIR|nr:P12 family lipoprotein [Candidatus Borrelia fainii]BDU63532.1 lipoprotein [Candidatus Borrelia fainii]
MNKSILPLFILIFLSLFSCDINTLNEMMLKSREKYLKQSNKVEDLNPNDGKQKGSLEQSDVFEQHMEKGLKHQVVQDLHVVPVNNMNKEIPVPQNFPYYPYQEEIDIKEEDLVPFTKEETDAYKAIKDIESVIKDSGFAKLIEDARELKDEYERLGVDLYNILSKLQEKRSFKGLSLGGDKFRKNRMEIKNLNYWYSCLREEYSNFERLINEIDIAIQDIGSAKSFFEKSQNTLKEAITKRLKSKLPRNRYLLRKGDSNLLAKQALREAENALTQLESSSSKIGEAMGIKKDIENLIQEARSVLVGFRR